MTRHRRTAKPVLFTPVGWLVVMVFIMLVLLFIGSRP